MDFMALFNQLQPILLVLIGLASTALARKFVKTRHDAYRMELFDKVADSTLALIRLNNPNLKLLDHVQKFEDQLFEALMKDPQVTYQPAIVKRLAATAIANAAVTENAVPFPVRK